MDKAFPCTKCGLCCKHISQMKELSHFDRGDGICKHLKENVCSMYENRPLICRIDDMYEAFYKTSFTKKQFYEINLQACAEMQQQFDTPQHLRVQIRCNRKKEWGNSK